MLKLLSILLLAQFTAPIHTGALASGAPTCTAPTMTDRWAVYDASTTCFSGCTSGNKVTSVSDLAGTNNLTNTGGTSSPAYTTGQINGLAAAVFNGGSSFLDLTTPIPASTTAMTYYAVVNVTAAGGTRAIFGCTASSGCMEWRVNGTHQELLNQGVAIIVTGAVTLSTGWHLLAMEYNTSTGVGSVYTCAGGTCTLDATATNAQTPTNAVGLVGGATGVSDFYDSGIAEVGFANSVSSTTRTQIGAWGSCKFAL